jgi:3',5'-cyclic AMP phosphodiesterase CpdA
MRPQQPVRDRNTSLWQSAVRETLLKRREDRAKQRAIEHAVSLQAKASVDKKKSLEELAAVLPEGDARTFALNTAAASGHAFDIAQAQRSGNTTAQATLFGKLTSLVSKYSTLDILGWAQCLLHYVEYYINAHASPPYRYWDEQKPQDITFGTIEWKLKASSKVLVLGDWGTHMSDNVALLRQALKAFKPDAIIHLGDVYYSGTVSECTDNVLTVLDDVFAELNMGRVPFFTIPGNHDYYSGGAGFFNLIDRVNASLPTSSRQKASYFCLRTEDDHWQFLAMDTGLNDRNPVDHMAPKLEKSEETWHRDKLDHFAGTTVLLSHHQLFSANSKIADGPRPYLNESLNSVFRPYYDKSVAAWFWGHEHNLVIFKDNQAFDEAAALRKGRLVGCSAYEETVAENPYKKADECSKVEYAPDMPELHLSHWATPLQKFYNHAFTLLEITPEKIVAKYYEYPSWDQDNKPNKEPAATDPVPTPTADNPNHVTANPVYTEEIPLLRS